MAAMAAGGGAAGGAPVGAPPASAPRPGRPRSYFAPPPPPARAHAPGRSTAARVRPPGVARSSVLEGEGARGLEGRDLAPLGAWEGPARGQGGYIARSPCDPTAGTPRAWRGPAPSPLLAPSASTPPHPGPCGCSTCCYVPWALGRRGRGG